MENSQYYTPTGKAPFSSLIITIVLGTIAGIILAAAYVLLQWFIPIVYFNFIITLGFGFGLFYALDFLHKNGKIRNLKFAILSAIIAAIVGYYIHWALFVSLMFNTDGTIGDIWLSSSFDSEGFMYFLLYPSELFEAVAFLNEIGTFSLKSSVVSGAFLWVIWAIEAVVMIAFPIVLLTGGQSTKPFSEVQNSWMDSRTLNGIFPFVQDKDILKRDFEQGNVDAIRTPLTDEEIGDQFMVASVYELLDDPHQYITITNVSLEYDKKGEVKRKEDIVLKYFCMPAGTL